MVPELTDHLRVSPDTLIVGFSLTVWEQVNELQRQDRAILTWISPADILTDTTKAAIFQTHTDLHQHVIHPKMSLTPRWGNDFLPVLVLDGESLPEVDLLIFGGECWNCIQFHDRQIWRTRNRWYYCSGTKLRWCRTYKPRHHVGGKIWKIVPNIADLCISKKALKQSQKQEGDHSRAKKGQYKARED